MGAVPEFGVDPKLIALDDARARGLLQGYSDFSFIAIDRRAIEMPVAELQCLQYGFTNISRCRFPGTKTDG
jgi:hypothetical protein